MKPGGNRRFLRANCEDCAPAGPRPAPGSGAGGRFKVARFAVAIWLVLGVGLAFAACRDAVALTDLQQQGQALVERMCARCHAVGRGGASPHAGAPPFRTLGRRLDVDALAGRLREGLASSHPDMPVFRFSRDDARAVAAYVRAIQEP